MGNSKSKYTNLLEFTSEELNPYFWRFPFDAALSQVFIFIRQF